MSLGPNEQIRAIISIQYLGADQVQRYLSDLQRLGAITDATAARITAAWRGAQSGALSYGAALRQLTGQLNLTTTAARALERQLEGIAFGRNEAALRSYNNQLRQLEQLSHRAAAGMNTLAQARQRLASAFATNLGAMAFDVRQGPVAGLAAGRPLELGTTASPPPAGHDPAERRMGRILDAIESRERAGNVIAGGNPFAGVNPTAEFERLNPVLGQTRSRVEALTAALARLNTRLTLDDPRTRAAATESAREINRGQMMALAAQYGTNDNNDALRRWAEMNPRTPVDRRLLSQGLLSPTHVRANPDLVGTMFQAQPYELSRGVGRGGAAIQLPGTTNPEAQLRAMQDELDQTLLRNAETRVDRINRALQDQARVAGAIPMESRQAFEQRQLAAAEQQAAQQQARLAAAAQEQERAAQQAAGGMQYRVTPTQLAMWGSLAPGYQMEAFKPGVSGPVGQMQWRQDTGEVASITTQPEFQRQGIATGMWQHTQTGLPSDVTRPVHSEDLTDAGRAWIASLENNKGAVDEATASMERMQAVSREATMIPGAGTTVGARDILAQSVAAQTPQPRGVGADTLAADVTRLSRALQGAGGNADLATRAMQAMGVGGDRIRAAFDELSSATRRSTQAEQGELFASRAVTQAKQQEAAASRAAAAAGALPPWRAGMPMSAMGATGWIPTGTGRAGAGAYLPGAIPPAATGSGAAAAAAAGQPPPYTTPPYTAVPPPGSTRGAGPGQYTTPPYTTPPYTAVPPPGSTRGAGSGQYTSGTGVPFTVSPGRPYSGGPYGGGGGGPYGGGYGGGGGGGPFGGGGGIFGGPPAGPFNMGGGGGGWRQQFMEGFRGRDDMTYAKQLGQTFKFSLFYGAAYNILFAITATLQQVLQEAIAFENAMVDLNIATGRTSEANHELAEQLGGIATEAGISPAEGLQTGARAIGLYGLGEASKEEQALAASMSTKVATQITTGSGGTRPQADIQADLGAISQNFDLGYQGQARVGDLDAYMARKYGIPVGSTLQPVAESGAVANLAGFSLEETMAISANLQSRTGQTASTIGGLLNQIFTRGGEGSLMDVAGKYGVQTRGTTLREQIEDLSQVYRRSNDAERTEIAASFGRGRSQNVAAVLLGQAPEIFRTAEEAKTGAIGAGQKQFDMRMETVGGQLKELGGAFMQFAHNLGEAGLLDALSLVVLALQGLLNAVNPVLELWNSMNVWVRRVILGLGALVVALRMGAGAAVVGMAQRGGAAFLGGRMMGIPNPVIAGAILGLVAIGAIKGSMDDMRFAAKNASTALGGFARGDRLADITGSDFRNQGSLLRTQADELRGSTGTLHNILTFGQADNAVDEFGEGLDKYARHANRIAKRLEALEETGAPPPVIFETFDAEGIAAGMELLAVQGRSTVGQFTALARALNHTANAAKEAERRFRPGLVAGELTSTTIGAISRVLPKELQVGTQLYNPEGYSGYGSETLNQAEMQAGLQEFLPPGKLQERLRAGIDTLGIKSERGVFKNANQLAAMAGEGVAAAILEGTGATPPQVRKLQQQINRAIARDLRKRTEAVAKALDPNATLTGKEVTAGALGLEAEAMQAINNRGETDYAGRVRRAQRFVTEVRALTDKGPATEEQQNVLNRARRVLAESRINQLEALRQAAQADATSQRQAARIGRRFMNREIRVAIRGGAGDELAEIIERGGILALEAVRNSINEALKVARAAARMKIQALKAVQQFAIALNPLLALGKPIELPKVSDDPAVARLLRLRNVTRHSPASRRREDNQFRTDYPGYQTPEERGGPDEREERRLARLAARDSAIAAGVGTDVAVAKAAIRDAKRRRDAAKHGSEDYWNAIADLRNSRRDLVDAYAAEATVRGPGKSSGDPAIDEARDSIRDARRRINASKRGSEDYWNAMRDFQDGQRALAEAQAARANAYAAAQVAPDDAIGQAQNAIDEAERTMARVPVGSTEYWEAVGARRQGIYDKAQAINERDSARRMAGVAPDDTLGQARNEMRDARDAMALATPNSAAYWEAVAQFQEAQFNYAQAQNELVTARARSQVAPDDAMGMARVEMEGAARAVRDATPGTAAHADALTEYRAARYAYGQAINEEADAAAAAEAARGGGAISAAKAQIESSVRAMNLATEGTAAYSQALETFYQGQQALQQAFLEYRTNLLLLRGDITNPLFEATVAQRIAREKLEKDIAAGRDPDVIAQDRVDLRRARAEREATAFSQRLQRIQTAEQLGRISHQRYIAYLENESDRLNRIKDRTYQQQQQLDQIDGLLKEAASQMQGQFNIGDIKLPTPYQVRRYIEQRVENMTPNRGRAGVRDVAGSRGNAVVNSNNTTTINIDGADIGRVRQVIREEVGTAARTRTAQPRRI